MGPSGQVVTPGEIDRFFPQHWVDELRDWLVAKDFMDPEDAENLVELMREQLVTGEVDPMSKIMKDPVINWGKKKYENIPLPVRYFLSMLGPGIPTLPFQMEMDLRDALLTKYIRSLSTKPKTRDEMERQELLQDLEPQTLGREDISVYQWTERDERKYQMDPTYKDRIYKKYDVVKPLKKEKPHRPNPADVEAGWEQARKISREEEDDLMESLFKNWRVYVDND